MFTRKVKKQLAKYIEIVRERGKNICQAGKWVCIFYSPILNSTRIWRVGEWLSAPLNKHKAYSNFFSQASNLFASTIC
jgi:hypothetical protein